MTDRVEVRKRTRRKSRKMVQIFVKVDGGKTSTMEMEMSDKVDDIVKKIPISDLDVYVTSGGRILRRSDKLESCEVRDGSTVEVMSRIRGGGKHKDKKSKVEKKQGTKQESLIPMDEAMRRLEQSEEFQKNMECMSEGSEGEVQQKVQNYLAHIQKVSWMNKEQFGHLESGIWQAVEARRKGRDEEQEERRRAQQGQEQSKQSKQVRFGEEQQLGKMGAENAGEPEAMGKTAQLRTGRGSAGLVRGEMRDAGRTRPAKGKEKGMEERVSTKAKEEDLGTAGKQQEMREREEERVRMAPNMGAGGSHPQAMADPEEEEMKEEEKKGVRRLRWADSEDDEG